MTNLEGEKLEFTDTTASTFGSDTALRVKR
jgi:hypothetical protein